MNRIVSTLILGCVLTLAPASAAPPEFFAMDTGTKDATHKTPAEQVALVKELGFAGIGPIYQNPATLRDMLTAVDNAKSKLFALYVRLDLDSPTPLSPEIRDSIEQLRGRDAILWLWITSSVHKPSDPAGDAQAVKALREIADLAEPAGVKIALYPHVGIWIERIEDTVRVARSVDRKNVGVTFNLCHWLKVDGKNLGTRLKDALPHLFVVTVNGADADGRDWRTLIQPLDRGTFDVEGMLRELRALGWHGPVGLQHFGIKGDAKANLKASIDAWNKMAPKVWTDPAVER